MRERTVGGNLSCVSAAEVVTDYSTILQRLADGHDIHRGALLESVLAQPLPQASGWAGGTAVIRRFEPNRLLVEVDAATNGLLVVAEAWHPGWRAEVDGQAVACVPANIWMRAVPVRQVATRSGYTTTKTICCPDWQFRWSASACSWWPWQSEGGARQSSPTSQIPFSPRRLRGHPSAAPGKDRQDHLLATQPGCQGL